MTADHSHHRQRSPSEVAPALVFLPLPLVGHLVSMVELAKRLSSSFSITFLTTNGAPLPSWSSPSSAFLRRLQSSSSSSASSSSSSSLPIQLLQLPPVEFTPDPLAHGVTTMAKFISAHKTHIKDYLSDLSQHVRVAGVVTEFVTSMVDAANELGLPAFVYFPSSAASLSTVIFPPPLPSPTPHADDPPELVHVAGISPVPRAALPGAMAVPDGYETFTYHARRFREARGVIINTFDELESPVLEALKGKSDLPPLYTVGPLLSLPSPEEERGLQHECIFNWLDWQPPRSVVFLCFGSMGCFEAEQVREIALGLERSGYRFLWTLRRKGGGPNNPPVDAIPEEDLPEGFLERTSERGMVWPTWSPQLEVLMHRAVGGFVTHCGWNSCLEGVWAGVPMLAWPLYAEQRLNASEMVKDMGVAIALGKRNTGEGEEEVLVGSDEVEKGVRCLMGEEDKELDHEEGIKVSDAVEAIKDSSRRAVIDGGSSRSAIERWIRDMLRGVEEGAAAAAAAAAGR